MSAHMYADDMCVHRQALQGSGPGGRVIAQDVSAARPVVEAASPTPVYAPGNCELDFISLLTHHSVLTIH